MPQEDIRVNRNTLPSWRTERQYSLSDLVESCRLGQKRRLQKDRIIDCAIYSRYQVPKLFGDLPKKKTSQTHMRKWNDEIREEKFPHCKEFANNKISRMSPVRIPVPNELYKLCYKHRPHHAWNTN